MSLYNFHKSKIIGVNIDNKFMNSALDFLSCATGSLPFSIPIVNIQQ